jgi:hypothetical protein
MISEQDAKQGVELRGDLSLDAARRFSNQGNAFRTE